MASRLLTSHPRPSSPRASSAGTWCRCRMGPGGALKMLQGKRAVGGGLQRCKHRCNPGSNVRKEETRSCLKQRGHRGGLTAMEVTISPAASPEFLHFHRLSFPPGKQLILSKEKLVNEPPATVSTQRVQEQT